MSAAPESKWKRIIELADGTRTVEQISAILGVDRDKIYRMSSTLKKRGNRLQFPTTIHIAMAGPAPKKPRISCRPYGALSAADVAHGLVYLPEVIRYRQAVAAIVADDAS